MKKALIIVSILLLLPALTHAFYSGGGGSGTDDQTAAEVTIDSSSMTYSSSDNTQDCADDLDGTLVSAASAIAGKQTANARLTSISGLSVASGDFIKVLTSTTFETIHESNMRGLESQTLQAFGDADATPDVTNGGTVVVRFWQTGATGAVTITDFDDGDDHSELSVGDWLVVRADDANTKIDMSSNANIEGNGGVDFTGSATQITYLYFIYDDSRWNLQGITAMSTPTTLAVSKVQAAGNAIASGGLAPLIASQMNSTLLMTAGGDVNIPADQCDTATGKWLIVKKSGGVYTTSITSDDASDYFVLSDGTVLDAQDELDLAVASGSQATIQCIQANAWWVIGEIGTCTDGGAAD